MASLGDVGLLVQKRNSASQAHNHLCLSIGNSGNGPITNTGLTAATAGGLILLSDRGTARVDATRANGSGVWSFYDLSQGHYTAVDVVTNGQWLIDVAADLTFTVTDNPGSPVTVAYAFA